MKESAVHKKCPRNVILKKNHCDVKNNYKVTEILLSHVTKFLR